jgi:hypothetical protein
MKTFGIRLGSYGHDTGFCKKCKITGLGWNSDVNLLKYINNLNDKGIENARI